MTREQFEQMIKVLRKDCEAQAIWLKLEAARAAGDSKLIRKLERQLEAAEYVGD